MNIKCQVALGFHPDSSIDVELEELAGHSNEMGDKFYSIMSDASKEIYLGCSKQSRLSTVIHLFHLKNLNNQSDESLDMLIDFINDFLPSGHTKPSSFYEMKK